VGVVVRGFDFMARLNLVLLVMPFCLLGEVGAQIYADFTVSHGGSLLGTFRARLEYDKAPRTCANFIGLATGQRAWLDETTGAIRNGTPYYDGLKFHRLDHDFVIQGGDPRGNGSGGPGYGFQDEFHSSLRHSGRYILSMANSGTNTNGSQFFITLEDASFLDDKHSVFGEVIDDSSYPNSRALIDSFTNAVTFPVTETTPQMDIVMNSVTISGPSLAGFNLNDPAYLLPTVGGVQTKIAYNSATTEYQMTWDRKNQIEYLSVFSSDLAGWLFVSNPYLLSLNDEDDWTYTVSGVTGDRFFSRLVRIDYSLMPRAPVNLDDNGKMVSITISASETVTLTFDGDGGGIWNHSSGGSGSISDVTWNSSAPAAGIFSSSSPQARFIPLGTLAVKFDTAVGTDRWYSFNLPVSFHTTTSGWTDGSAVIDNPDGEGTVTVVKRVPFTYTP
jgi:peptidyl-prolyl cis-trans isomerase A (cyclophilin A)